MSFTAADLEALDALLYARADAVVAMRDVLGGTARTIGLRHDVDDNPGSFATALRMAEWEHERGYASTYFLLHDSHYWGEHMLRYAPRLEALGHEVGLHVNAIAEGIRQRRDPHDVLTEALAYLRSSGVTVTGCVAHGDDLCYADAAKTVLRFVNDEVFTESARPNVGKPTRTIRVNGSACQLLPMSRRAYGLEYDPNWLSRGDYLSDSGGKWSQPVDEVAGRFGSGQLHMLVHPDWWKQAFTREAVAA